jgi:hypothetical protein
LYAKKTIQPVVVISAGRKKIFQIPANICLVSARISVTLEVAESGASWSVVEEIGRL